ncbi:MAG: hypothetical protein AAGN82_06620 [Myxococcota bacterium]
MNVGVVRSGVVVALLLLSGCSPALAPVAAAPEFEPPSQTKCQVAASQRRPLVVEWPSADRAALEALAKQGTVVVRYEGCEMELLPQCHARGGYTFTGTSIKQDRLSITNADELYAEVPLGAPKLEAKLARAGELNVDMTVVGRFDGDTRGLTFADLEGRCAEATHVITGLTAGAFTFFAGGSAEASAGASAFGAEAGGRSDASKEVLNRDGDPRACETTDGLAPPAGCSAILRVEVAPLAQAADTPAVLGRSAPPFALGNLVPSPDAKTPGRFGLGTVKRGPGVVKLRITGEGVDERTQIQGDGVSLLEPRGREMVNLGPRRLICTAPCDQWLDARMGQPVFVVGPDYPAAGPFNFFDREGELELEVDPGNGAVVTAGGWLAVLGGLSVIGGLSTLLVAGLVDSSDSRGDQETADDLYLAGGLLTGIGAGVMVPGIFMLVYGDTSVEVRSALAPPP